MTKHIVLLPGDGIGPEVTEAVKLVIDAVGGITFEEHLIGGTAYDECGTPLPPQTLAACKAADGVLLSCVGGPHWADVPYDKRPEAGLLAIRREMGLFANLRPAIVFDALIDASSLKPEIIRGLDILIVRELTGGVYFGQPRGIEDLGNGQRRGINTQVYTTYEVRRVAEVAFDLARARAHRVCSVEKSNVMESGLMWRQDVTQLHHESHGDIALTHMYADNCTMQLLRNPSQFDVIVTDNLFGDILSDAAAMLTGSLGMLPSASLGAVDAAGKRPALYEPVHGSAPDIAGQDKANPLAMILSFAMCLRYSLNDAEAAGEIESAVKQALEAGIRTADIMAPGCTQVGTMAMAEAVVDRLGKTA